MARTRSRKSLALGIAALLAVGLVGAATVTAATAQGGPPGTADSGVIWAQPYAKVVGVDPPSQLLSAGGTLLEGPSIGANGQLYFVDLTAPGGAPKVLELNLQTKKITPLHTDSTSSLSSLTFSPVDGKAYLTDLSNGDIYSMNPDGSDFTTVLSGPVLGRQSAAEHHLLRSAGQLLRLRYGRRCVQQDRPGHPLRSGPEESGRASGRPRGSERHRVLTGLLVPVDRRVRRRQRNSPDAVG
jgi:lactonase